jgi:succinate dehydrogenase hydrophobic anchor subunit
VSNAPGTAAGWPGERLGLPDSGPRSVGRLGRRILALLIDWGLAYLIAWAFLPHSNGTVDAWWTLAVFAIEQILFLIVINASLGHLVLGMRLVPIVPAPLGLWRPVVRTVLLCFVIPAVIWDRDQRGLHDRVAGTVLVRR